MIGEEINEGLVSCCGAGIALDKKDMSSGVTPMGQVVPLSRPLISDNFPASSSFRKSFVFCAKSFLCTVESRWCATISEAVLSMLEIRVVKSRPTVNDSQTPPQTIQPALRVGQESRILLHCEIAF
jgi:hypothetical protein